jgi:hypothetical protein
VLAIGRAIQKLFSILSKWEANGHKGLTLEISASSPTGIVHTLYCQYCNTNADTDMLANPHHDWDYRERRFGLQACGHLIFPYHLK